MCIRKTSITALNHQHLKAKDIQGISVNLKIQQILGLMNLKATPTQKPLKQHLALQFVASSKTPIYSNYSHLRYIQI